MLRKWDELRSYCVVQGLMTAPTAQEPDMVELTDEGAQVMGVMLSWVHACGKQAADLIVRELGDNPTVEDLALVTQKIGPHVDAVIGSESLMTLLKLRFPEAIEYIHS